MISFCFIQQPQAQPNQGILNAMNSGISPLLLATGGIANPVAATSGNVAANLAPGFLGGIFARRERKLSKSEESGASVSSTIPVQATNIDRSTEV